MPTEQQTETLTRRQIAEAFVEKWPIFASPVDAVELLLKCRDERAAKIAEDALPIGSDDCYWCERIRRSAAAIRNEGHK